MKKVRKAHLWIGLIASVFIFIEALTGLLMNEPWIIGQSEQHVTFEGMQGRGNFNFQQFNQGQNSDGTPSDNLGQAQRSGQFQPPEGFRNKVESQNSFIGIIKGLHEGRIGNTNIKWLMDLAALAMMFLTGSGIFLSINVLRNNRKRKKKNE